MTYIDSLLQRFDGMVGVAAGMIPNSDYPETSGNEYNANALTPHPETVSGSTNEQFVFNVASGYSFEADLPGLRDVLLRMYAEGVGNVEIPSPSGTSTLTIP